MSANLFLFASWLSDWDEWPAGPASLLCWSPPGVLAVELDVAFVAVLGFIAAVELRDKLLEDEPVPTEGVLAEA